MNREMLVDQSVLGRVHMQAPSLTEREIANFSTI